jgi:non-specific serine/threonine protein kinase
LAIFVGGWTLEDAEAIVNGGGDILDGLASLVDESLVRQESEGEPRFTMLETIRDYAAERLESSGEAEDLRQRHATRFLEVAEESEHGLTGPDQLQWLRLLETEQDNLRAALAWAVQARRGDVALRLASALTRFWHTRSFLNEGRTWLAAALEVGADQPPELRGKALTRLGVLLLRLGLAGETKPLLEESLALHREIGDPEGTALSLIHLSHVAVREGDSSSAEQMLEESLALYESLGDQRGIAVIRVNLGYVAVTQGEYARSIRPLDQSLAFFEEIGDRLGTAHAAFNLGLARLFQGRPEEAEEALGRALRCAASVGSTEEIICSLVCLAAAAQRRDPERTARLLGAAERLGEEIAFVLDPFEQDLCDETAARVRAALSAATFEQAWNAGRALDCDEAVALASTAHA